MKYDSIGNSQRGSISPYLVGGVTVLSLFALILQPMRHYRVPVTEIGLLVDQYGSNETRAIENAQTIKGAVWYNSWTQEIITVPRRQQEFKFTNDSDEYSELPQQVNFSVGGSPIGEEIGVEVAWKSDQLANYYAKYGEQPIDFIRTNFLVGLQGCYNVQGQGLTPSEYQAQRTAIAQDVQSCLNARFPEVDVVALDLLDQPEYADAIQTSIDEQFQAQQRAQQAESNRAQAEAQGLADVAKAEAEAAVRLIEAENRAAVQKAEAGTVNDQLIQLRRLEIDLILAEAEKIRAEGWNGQEPNTIVQSANTQVGAQN